VKSLKYGKERILVARPSNNGYLYVTLSNTKPETKRIHHLVWDAFGDKRRNGMKLQIDHIDENKTNNHIDNLQLLTGSENLRKYHSQNRTLPSGIYWFKRDSLYIATEFIDNKSKYLGRYKTLDGAITAQKKAKEII